MLPLTSLVLLAASMPLPDQQPPTVTVAPAAPAPSRDISWSIPSFAKNFFSDQKKIWTFPVKVATGHHLLPVAGVALGTAAVVRFADPTEARYFRNHAGTFTGFNNTLSEHVTTSATLLVPASMAAAGLITRRSYLSHTGLLALEAWVDVDIVGEIMRNVAGRRRPLDVPPNGSYGDTWFKAGHNPLKSSGSFPSGHTAWGFAVATVIARRYPDHKWIGVLAYGLATVDAVSRLTSSNHFLSDTAFGGVLGYSIGRFVVLRN